MRSESESGKNRIEGMSPKTKEVVQSLKEIVKHCTEQEIYAVLKECNMDPNEAAQRLLSQDTFHEVKSKRERRKEMKETQESSYCGNNSGLNRGVRGNNSECNVVWSGPTQTSYNELGKAAYDGESGLDAILFSSSTTHVPGKTLSQQPLPHGDSLSTDNGRQSIGTGDPVSASVQPSSVFQTVWSGATSVRPSMADIVKMGRLQNKGSQISTVTSYMPQDAVAPNSSHHHAKPPQVSAPLQQELHPDLHHQYLSNMSAAINEYGIGVGQHVLKGEWSGIEEPITNSGSSVADTYATFDAEICCSHSNSHDNRANLFRNCQSDAVQASEGDVSENLSFDTLRYASASRRQRVICSAEGASERYNNLLKDISSYDSHMCFEHQEGSGSHLSHPNHSSSLTDDSVINVSSAAFQRLSLRNGDPAVPPTEDNRTVVFPNHLQAVATDCLQLSFGTYKSGSNSAFSEPFGSNTLKLGLGKASAAIHGSSDGHLDARNFGYSDDGQLTSMYDTLTVASSARNYDLLASSQLELMNQNTPGENVGCDYITKSHLPYSGFSNTQQPSSAFSFARENSQIRNLPAFSSQLHPCSDTIRSDLNASTIKSLRDFEDLLHSPFPVTRSTSSIYNNAGSPISSPSNSMLQILNPAAFSQAQPSSVHSQRLPHRYSQPNVTLEQLGNMINRPSRPQSNVYMPSSLEEAYPGSSASNQSLAGTKYSLPQYNSGGQSSRFLLPASNSSGYGSFGTSTDNSGRFLHNPSTDLTIPYGGYDDVLRSHYKEGNHLTPFQQNDCFSVWDFGPGSRTMSSVPDSTYYSAMERNQQNQLGQQHAQQRNQQNQLVQQHSQQWNQQNPLGQQHSQQWNQQNRLGQQHLQQRNQQNPLGQQHSQQQNQLGQQHSQQRGAPGYPYFSHS